MSILDSINKAEERAAEMRSEAKAKARETLRQAETEAREKGDALILEAREASEAVLLQEEALAEKEMERVLHDASLADEKMAENARIRVPKAVEFILERVETQ